MLVKVIQFNRKTVLTINVSTTLTLSAQNYFVTESYTSVLDIISLLQFMSRLHTMADSDRLGCS